MAIYCTHTRINVGDTVAITLRCDASGSILERFSTTDEVKRRRDAGMGVAVRARTKSSSLVKEELARRAAP